MKNIGFDEEVTKSQKSVSTTQQPIKKHIHTSTGNKQLVHKASTVDDSSFASQNPKYQNLDLGSGKNKRTLTFLKKGVQEEQSLLVIEKEKEKESLPSYWTSSQANQAV